MKFASGIGLLVLLIDVVSSESRLIPIFRMRRLGVPHSSSPKNGNDSILTRMTASEGQFPYAVFLVMKKHSTTCTASLIHPRWILTAAHCVINEPELTIIAVAGKANLMKYIEELISPQVDINERQFDVQVRKIDKVKIHPQYSFETNVNDMALLRVKKPFHVGDRVKTIRLANRRMETPKKCTILGWGLNEAQIQSFQLLFVHDVKASTDCKNTDSGPFVCLGEDDVGVCKGDSGSPLVCDGEVWGISSFSYTLDKNKCGEADEDVFTQTYPGLEWIQRTISESSSGSKPIGMVLLCSSLVFLVFLFR